MKWFILLVGVVVLCFVVALVLGWVGGVAGGMGRPGSSLSHEPLPEGELHDDDLEELAFDVTFRGYRMSQVDGVVDRLRRELREKDEHIAFLRSRLGAADDPASPDGSAAVEATEATAATEATEGPAALEPAHPNDVPKA
ncbi:DivIVA domain-containing protein [Intrasporangium sp.]|uniref:DivIVA domain-containing protein n=1 Tax=Intrasporangium sp. TaxID=1925024 RepID=UPI00293A25A4|nr:DivIVA domain-containing protein [Intrasporangium sp.]MDV3221414.1 DivIVA domain-containing protein [Intrasporangium sp.]